jgi:hypothetical protein
VLSSPAQAKRSRCYRASVQEIEEGRRLALDAAGRGRNPDRPTELDGAICTRRIQIRLWRRRRFRHDRRTIERWLYGERRIPQGIVILLHLIETLIADKVT